MQGASLVQPDHPDSLLLCHPAALPPPGTLQHSYMSLCRTARQGQRSWGPMSQQTSRLSSTSGAPLSSCYWCLACRSSVLGQASTSQQRCPGRQVLHLAPRCSLESLPTLDRGMERGSMEEDVVPALCTSHHHYSTSHHHYNCSQRS